MNQVRDSLGTRLAGALISDIPVTVFSTVIMKLLFTFTLPSLVSYIHSCIPKLDITCEKSTL